jgi:hypothetical protein
LAITVIAIICSACDFCCLLRFYESAKRPDGI